MDWLNEPPSVTGIDGIVAKMKQRLMDGPVMFQNPYWNSIVVHSTLDYYRAWISTVQKLGRTNADEGRLYDGRQKKLTILKKY